MKKRNILSSNIPDQTTHKKAVCIGRNYTAHAKELNNPVPQEPLLFIKPASAITTFDSPINACHPFGTVHYETEIALLIGQSLSQATPEKAIQAVTGLGVALDLTLRDLQSELKKKGHPWEKAKAFDRSCVVSPFVPVTTETRWDDIPVELILDNKIVQQGNSALMLTPISELLSYISQFFTLESGDIVLTGTPEGVGQLQAGQTLCAKIPGLIEVNTTVI